jgi:non-homologous end joining protein Ku
MNKVAIGRVVLTNRGHIIALDPLDKASASTLLRYRAVRMSRIAPQRARETATQKRGAFC